MRWKLIIRNDLVKNSKKDDILQKQGGGWAKFINSNSLKRMKNL